MTKTIKNIFLTICLTVLIFASIGFVASVNKGGKVVNAAGANVALKANNPNVKISSTLGTDNSLLNDGITDNNSWWEAEPYPCVFEVDLGGYYNISQIKLFCHSGGSRYYDYKMYWSLSGRDYVEFAANTNKAPSTLDGYVHNESLTARYIRVEMLKNSANIAIHVREIEIYGTATTWTDNLSSVDPTDANNVAYLKKATTNLTFMDPNKVTDGGYSSLYFAKYAPVYVDVDLEQSYSVNEVLLFFRDVNSYYNYTVYGSVDGDNFVRLGKNHSTATPTNIVKDQYTSAIKEVITVDGSEYRFIRVYLEYQQNSGAINLSEVKVHGTATGKNTGDLRTGSIDKILDIKPYSETEFDIVSNPITNNETINNVYGIIERTVGKLYKSWFEFKIAESENGYDYYTISDSASGKILITGNNGISLASGVNYYFKTYAKVNITEQANQTLMPKQIIPVGTTVLKETPYETRYAFNYCTMDYSFVFYTESDWQKEYDYLALNGVNLALDLTGQEAIWIKFLMEFGYSYDDAKSWLSGPAYYAWQFMDNMEVYGGAVTDGWVKERLESARRMQRWRLSLGMQTCLQAYVGMVPNNFSDYQPQVEILEQGIWCGFDRPDMIRTDSTLYDDYCELFYAAQDWAFGNTTNYYAADPFHEGGIRPSDGSLTDDVVAKHLLDGILEYDADGVWVVQAWHSNPTNELLRGMADRKDDHCLILDLCALEAPKWNRTTYGEDGEGGTTLDSIEFNSTPWVWCMLDNYGGNPSMDGEMQAMIDRLREARENAQYLKGIGIIPEATLDNPAIYNMLFDMTWDTFTLEDWTKEYITARYGRYSDSAYEGWQLLQKVIYTKNGWYRTIPWIMTVMPESIQGSNPQTLPYDTKELEEALSLLLKDYDLLVASEGYRYDIVEILHMIVNNYSVDVYNQLLTAFNSKDTASFITLRAKFENSFDVMNEVLGTRNEWLMGEWVGKAQDWGNLIDNDFAYDTFVVQAKTLITTWGNELSMYWILDYAQRNYEGMITDVYKTRWITYLDKMQANLENGTAIDKLNVSDYYHYYRQWIMKDTEYTREANESLTHLWEVIELVYSECSFSNMTVTKNDRDDSILSEYAERYDLINRAQYSDEQLTVIDNVKTSVDSALNSSITEETYYNLILDIYSTYDVIANPYLETAPEPEPPTSSASGTVSSSEATNINSSNNEEVSNNSSSKGNTDISSSATSSNEATNSPSTNSNGATSSSSSGGGKRRGCKGNVSGGTIISLLALAGVGVLISKKKFKRY